MIKAIVEGASKLGISKIVLRDLKEMRELTQQQTP